MGWEALAGLEVAGCGCDWSIVQLHVYLQRSGCHLCAYRL